MTRRIVTAREQYALRQHWAAEENYVGTAAGDDGACDPATEDCSGETSAGKPDKADTADLPRSDAKNNAPSRGSNSDSFYDLRPTAPSGGGSSGGSSSSGGASGSSGPGVNYGPAAGSGDSGGDTGGSIRPETQATLDWINQNYPQFTDIGGYRAPDGYNEHSSGSALDVMYPQGYDVSQGAGFRNDVFKNNPNVDYILNENMQWNRDGTSSSGISSPHTDHFHLHES